MPEPVNSMDSKKPIHTDLIRGALVGALAGLVVLAVAVDWRSGVSADVAALPMAAQFAQSQTKALVPIAAPRQLDLGDATASHDAQRLAQWVVNAADNGSSHFVILDKRDARIHVFDAEGRLLGSSPVLLGSARGDHSVPGIGERPIEHIRPDERTTPAGRFVSEPGRNHVGEDVIWVDYDAAVSMHRVRLNNPAERRAERLASPTADDNRISYGCINLPVDFFERVLWPIVRDNPGVIYVMPEQMALEQVFPALADASETHTEPKELR